MLRFAAARLPRHKSGKGGRTPSCDQLAGMGFRPLCDQLTAQHPIGTPGRRLGGADSPEDSRMFIQP